MNVLINRYATCLFAFIVTASGYSRGPFDPHRDARQDLRSAELKAKAEHKRILLDFGANWCAPCVTLDHLFQTDPEIHKILDSGYILVKIPVEMDKDSIGTSAIRKQYPSFNVVPNLLITDSNGKKLWYQPNGPLLADPEKGLWNKRAVLAFLQSWARKPR